jgi:hypothetical protein
MFIGLLASAVALVTGFAVVSFTLLRGTPQPQRLLLIGFSVAGIADLGWTAAMLSGEITGLTHLIVTAALFLCGASISFLGSSETVTGKMIDEPVDRSDRDEWNNTGLGGA